jgi:hypothetical protein
MIDCSASVQMETTADALVSAGFNGLVPAFRNDQQARTRSGFDPRR